MLVFAFDLGGGCCEEVDVERIMHHRIRTASITSPMWVQCRWCDTRVWGERIGGETSGEPTLDVGAECEMMGFGGGIIGADMACSWV